MQLQVCHKKDLVMLYDFINYRVAGRRIGRWAGEPDGQGVGAAVHGGHAVCQSGDERLWVPDISMWL